MQYIRTTTKQEAIEAESPEEAHTKQGRTIDITIRVFPRPVTVSTPQQAQITPPKQAA